MTTLLSQTTQTTNDEDDYARIERALTYIAAHMDEQPALAALAAEQGLSEFHFQRVFTRWAGVSPKRFLQHLTVAAARERLVTSASVLGVAMELGLSGPGRLHDLFITTSAMTPGEFKSGGEGMTVTWGGGVTPFGEAVVLLTERGIAGLAFVAGRGREAALAEASPGLSRATYIQDEAAAGKALGQVFATGQPGKQPLSVWLRGTPFQLRVWEALLRVPEGGLISYGQLAGTLRHGDGAGAQAVGSAVGANHLAFLIPCHRVIRATGAFGEYRWGRGRKLALIGAEATASAAAGGG